MKINKVIFKIIALMIIQAFLTPGISCPKTITHSINVYLRANTLSPALMINKESFLKSFHEDAPPGVQTGKLSVDMLPAALKEKLVKLKPFAKADHSWGVSLLVLMLGSEDIVLERALTMAVIHHLEDKGNVWEKLLTELPEAKRQYFAEVFAEYILGETKTARFVKACDKLQMALQAYYLKSLQNDLDISDFLESAQKSMKEYGYGEDDLLYRLTMEGIAEKDVVRLQQNLLGLLNLKKYAHQDARGSLGDSAWGASLLALVLCPADVDLSQALSFTILMDLFQDHSSELGDLVRSMQGEQKKRIVSMAKEYMESKKMTISPAFDFAQRCLLLNSGFNSKAAVGVGSSTAEQLPKEGDVEREYVPEKDISSKDISPYVRMLFSDFKSSVVYLGSLLRSVPASELKNSIERLDKGFNELYQLTIRGGFTNQEILSAMEGLRATYTGIIENQGALTVLGEKYIAFQEKIEFLNGQLNSFYQLCSGSLIEMEEPYGAEEIVGFSNLGKDGLMKSLNCKTNIDADKNFRLILNKYILKAVMDSLGWMARKSIVSGHPDNPKINLEFRQKGETLEIVISYPGKIADERLETDPETARQRIFLPVEIARSGGFQGLEPDNLWDIVAESGGMITADCRDGNVIFTMSFHPLKSMVVKKIRELKMKQKVKDGGLLTNAEDQVKWGHLSVSSFDLWVQWHFDYGNKNVLEKLMTETDKRGIGYLEEFKRELKCGLPLYASLFRLYKADKIGAEEMDAVATILESYKYVTDIEKLKEYNQTMADLFFTHMREAERLTAEIDSQSIAASFCEQSV